ncbi:hypothetical protein C8J57DRAFT_504703 [Mycena rebaudengoi]|nr:hypothetical protein C8J57DRAFT_504703 [Mycena rebaudengoi]
MSQLNPAREQAKVAKAELESRDAQMKRLEEENRKWQERNTQLLSKYDRIDPADVQSLKDEIERLKTLVAEGETTKANQDKAFLEQQEHTKAVENNLRTFKEQHQKNNESFRARMGIMNVEKSAANAERTQLVAKISTLEAEIKTLQESKASSEAERTTNTQALSAEASSQASTIVPLYVRSVTLYWPRKPLGLPRRLPRRQRQ